jgi:hypothetical protein
MTPMAQALKEYEERRNHKISDDEAEVLGKAVTKLFEHLNEKTGVLCEGDRAKSFNLVLEILRETYAQGFLNGCEPEALLTLC